VKSIVIIVAVGLLSAIPVNAQNVALTGRPEAGANVFKKCMACHQLGPDARNSVGPVLNGVVGRKAGVFPGYPYSPANKSSALVWDEQTLARYLRVPREVVPGTKMAFAGLNKAQDVADVIAYLKLFDANGNKAAR
jgi:cytochrome c